MTKHDKLIRSKIPQDLDSKNIPYKIHMAEKDEYGKKLYEKLGEEAQELINKPLDMEELADLLEVVEAIKSFNNWNTQEIEEIRLKKRDEKGGFDEPIILEES